METPDLARIRAALAARNPARVRDDVSSRAAVALILRGGPSGLDVLFIRRAEDPRDPWSGQMAFPGGRSEPGDADLRTTAIRETAEEVGLHLDREAEYLGSLDEVRAMARLRPMDLAITPFVFHAPGDSEMTPSHEVTSIHWLPLETLLSPEAQSSFEYRHDGGVLTFPSLQVQEVVIWGLTYRMLGSFTALLSW